MSITVGRLWHHPVKSMQGQAVGEVVLGPGGLVGDRAYGFVDVETDRLVSAKHPKRYASMLSCRAAFVHRPRVDGPTPPVRVTFPDGTTVDGDQEEIAR
ncbi:MAG: MOSC N-terminal beta barrel domain-containing protein [Acidimicrobiia bacterium]